MSTHTHDFPFQAYRRLRFAGRRPRCPHCGARHVHSWGGFSGRRRYRCVPCRRTFSDFTGTPLAHLKRIDRWPAFCVCMLESRTVRATGQALGVHKDTAFRWRHRVLDSLSNTDHTPLGRFVLLHEAWFPYSRKGQRLPRASSAGPPNARRNGRSVRSPGEQAWVVFARDETGRLDSKVVGRSRPGAADLDAVLAPRLRNARALSSRFGPYGAAATLATRTGRDYRFVRRREGGFAAMNRYVVALRVWLRRFRGVATRYLDRYLAWHRLLEAVTGGPPHLGRVAVLAARFP